MYQLKLNTVTKAVSKEGTNLHSYIKECGLIQLVPSTDDEGEICLAFTDLGVITIYFEGGKIMADHRLPCGDYYVQEFSAKGMFVCDEIRGFDIHVMIHF